MTRTIKFRGKRVDNGEWVFGGIKILSDKEVFIICKQGIALDFSHQVIPESVGQFSGLLDKEGNEIFEGDVVEIFKSRYAVEWDSKYSLFALHRPIGRIASYPFVDYDRAKVIGTIHDNPELL